MDTFTQPLYILALIGILLLIAAILYSICYLINRLRSDEDVDDDSEVGGITVTSPSEFAAAKYMLNRETRQNCSNQQRDARKSLLASGKQTMLSSLTRSAKDSDVILATAISSIPLKELGGKDNDIIVDVGQQLYLNKDLKSHQDHQCIVCKSRERVTWNQVSCYAQTTIGVLVYKRAQLVANQQPATPTLAQELKRSVSNTTLAPSADSRLTLDFKTKEIEALEEKK